MRHLGGRPRASIPDIGSGRRGPFRRGRSRVEVNVRASSRRGDPLRAGEPKEGYCIEGRYLLNEEIGRGGHGVVYRAFDYETGATVAVKVLKDSVAEDSEYAIRLWREAQSMKALWGTSVVRVY